MPLLPDASGYEYGQVGVGTCLASPSDLRVRPDPLDLGENHFLFVVNSNSRSNFSGSSLLSIDASTIDLEEAANLDDVAENAFEGRHPQTPARAARNPPRSSRR